MAYPVKTTLLLFVAALISIHAHRGDAAKGGCQPSDIAISQRVTGKVVEGQPEYRVTIENRCSCPQAAVKVRCYGLSTVEDLDKTKIRPIDSELCIVADGKPIAKGSPVTFTYAFKTPQSFPVVSAKPQC